MNSANETKFNEVYEAFFPRMIRFATRLCRNRDEAEDITQVAFIKAYKHFDNCEDVKGIKNWLMRITYNTFLDFRRKDQRRITQASYSTLDDVTIEDHADPVNTVEDEIFGNVFDPILQEAICNLDKASQELLIMAYVQELSHGEIGEKLGVNAGACRSRIHRLCCRLRRDIAKTPSGRKKFSALA
jgi:RNA polymerase sigma-70 factor (ECF subfamily)